MIAHMLDSGYTVALSLLIIFVFSLFSRPK
jgi:hypothetical protein